MPSPRITIPASALIIAAVLAGCGGSSTVSAGSYVKTLCQAVTPYEKDVQTRSAQFTPALLKDPGRAKPLLQSFFVAAGNDANSAVSKLQSAGTPNVKNGKQISNAILGAFTQLRNAMQKAASQSGNLPTNSTQAFQNGARTVLISFRNTVGSIGQNLSASTLQSEQLQQAASKEPACNNFG